MAAPVVWLESPEALQARMWSNSALRTNPKLVARLKRHGLSVAPPPPAPPPAAGPSAPVGTVTTTGAFRFSGVASMPIPDRGGDIIELAGVTFDAEIPLLLQHDSHMPIGIARLKKTSDAIRFDAELPHIPEGGLLHDRLAYVRTAVQARILRGVSIGFTASARDTERLSGGGQRFKAIVIHELSVVSLPMHQAALIDAPGVTHIARAVPASPGLRLAVAASLEGSSRSVIRPGLLFKGDLSSRLAQ